MIYLFTALYAEASALIRQFHLKKDTAQTRFQLFRSDDAGICLTVTGTGMMAGAAAVSCICTEYRAGAGDFLLNIGICACMEKQENAHVEKEIFLCNKIIEQTTGKTFYPDLLYRCNFQEAGILTGAKPFIKKEADGPKNENILLYDMEASAVYQAGSYFFGPHQMSFLKIVSDCGDAGTVAAGQAEQLINDQIGSIVDYMDLLRAAGQAEAVEAIEAAEAIEVIEKLHVDLHCSKTMSASLRQHIRYCALAGMDYVSVIHQMYQEHKLPCQNKREGKRCFEELRKRLL